MQKISILCLLFCTMAINPLHAQSSTLKTIDSISMIHAPDGYVEVKSSDFQEYIGALHLESALQAGSFIRLFVKTEEYPLVQQKDIDELSGTVIAVWLQNHKTFKKEDFIDVNMLTKIFSNIKTPSHISSFLSNFEMDFFLTALKSKININRMDAIKASFIEYNNNSECSTG